MVEIADRKRGRRVLGRGGPQRPAISGSTSAAPAGRGPTASQPATYGSADPRRDGLSRGSEVRGRRSAELAERRSPWLLAAIGYILVLTIRKAGQAGRSRARRRQKLPTVEELSREVKTLRERLSKVR